MIGIFSVRETSKQNHVQKNSKTKNNFFIRKFFDQVDQETFQTGGTKPAKKVGGLFFLEIE